MALGARQPGENWMEPATKADLQMMRADVKLMRADLTEMIKDVEGKVKDVEGKVKDVEGKVKDVEGKVKDVEGQVKDVEGKVKDVEGQVKDSRVEMVEMGATLRREMSEQNEKLRDRIDRNTEEISKMRTQVALMVIGVGSFLASLITIFQFLL